MRAQREAYQRARSVQSQTFVDHHVPILVTEDGVPCGSGGSADAVVGVGAAGIGGLPNGSNLRLACSGPPSAGGGGGGELGRAALLRQQHAPGWTRQASLPVYAGQHNQIFQQAPSFDQVPFTAIRRSYYVQHMSVK